MDVFRDAVRITRSGHSDLPYLIRRSRKRWLGKSIDMRSVSNVPRPTKIASASALTSSNRCLSWADVKRADVCLLVETLPSAVTAKCKITNGRRCDEILTNGQSLIARGRPRMSQTCDANPFDHPGVAV